MYLKNNRLSIKIKLCNFQINLFSIIVSILFILRLVIKTQPLHTLFLLVVLIFFGYQQLHAVYDICCFESRVQNTLLFQFLLLLELLVLFQFFYDCSVSDVIGLRYSKHAAVTLHFSQLQDATVGVRVSVPYNWTEKTQH